MTNKPKTNLFNITAGLFLLIGGIWIVFSLITIFRSANHSTMPVFLFWVLSILMIGNGVFLIITGWGIYHQKRSFYWFGLFWLAVNIILTFTDQFGVFDLITLVIDLGLFGLLIFIRKTFI